MKSFICWNTRICNFNFFSPHHKHTHGKSTWYLEDSYTPSILHSIVEDCIPLLFFVLIKVSHYLFYLRTTVLAGLILSRGRCKLPPHLHHGLFLATCRLSTCPVVSITVLTGQTLPKNFRIICAINLWFTQCTKVLESHLLEDKFPKCQPLKNIFKQWRFLSLGVKTEPGNQMSTMLYTQRKRKHVLVCVCLPKHVCLWWGERGKGRNTPVF